MKKFFAAIAAMVMAVVLVSAAPAQAAIYANSINIKMGKVWVNVGEEYIAVQDKICGDNKQATVRFQHFNSNYTITMKDPNQCDAVANVWYEYPDPMNIEWYELCYPLAPSGWHCTERRYVVY